MSCASSVASIEEFNQLEEWHTEALKPSRMSACTTLVAALLLLPSLIVLVGASLCLTLPGVNVINQVVLPAIVPACCAILASIPLIVYSVKQHRASANKREEIITKLVEILNTNKEQVGLPYYGPRIIKKNVLDPEWHKSYQMKILTEVQKKYKDTYPLPKDAEGNVEKDAHGKPLKDPVVEALANTLRLKPFNPHPREIWDQERQKRRLDSMLDKYNLVTDPSDQVRQSIEASIAYYDRRRQGGTWSKEKQIKFLRQTEFLFRSIHPHLLEDPSYKAIKNCIQYIKYFINKKLIVN